MSDNTCWTAFERYSISNGMPPKRDSPAWRLWVAAWEARVPEGCVLVPTEPTGEMIAYGAEALKWQDYDSDAESCYRAMIAAAQEDA